MRNRTLVISAGDAYQTVFVDLYIKFLGGLKIDARHLDKYDHFSFMDGSTVLVDHIFDLEGIEPEEFFGLLSLHNTMFFGDYSKITKDEFEFAKLSISDKQKAILEDEAGLMTNNMRILAQFHPGQIKVYGVDMDYDSHLYPSNQSYF